MSLSIWIILYAVVMYIYGIAFILPASLEQRNSARQAVPRLPVIGKRYPTLYSRKMWWIGVIITLAPLWPIIFFIDWYVKYNQNRTFYEPNW